MAERKRPRRTRERILEQSLALFNARGVSGVTTAEIAGELNISPGNLYYHFRNKEEIVAELCSAFEARMAPLFADPGGRRVAVLDLWLWLHLMLERMGEYRFILREVDVRSRRAMALGTRLGRLLQRGIATMVELCRGMVDAGTMTASESEIAALAHNVPGRHLLAVVRSDRPRAGCSGRRRGSRSRRVAGVFADRALSRPEARAVVDRLSRGYL
jgi:AcrR family transcriptional regulator